MGDVRQRWHGQIFVGNGEERVCGVAILVKQGVVSGVHLLYTDTGGRVVGVGFKFQGVEYVLYNVRVLHET